ncbi:MAG: hypothetical protein ABIK86_01905 [candidate division WOR-3 bacterium]
MNRIIRLLLLAVVGFALFGRATCGRTKPAARGITPVLKLTIKDHVYYHNMGITWDSEHYYTVNGGNSDYCNLNKYDRKGNLVASYDVGIDGRAIFWHPEDEELFVKVHGTSLYSVDLEDEYADEATEDIATEDNSSVGFSPDGERVYELSGGTVTVRDFDSGDELASFELAGAASDEDQGRDKSIAVSDKYIFAWEDENTIRVYNLEGAYLVRFDLPRPGFGSSLSWANGLLWIAEDADGKDSGADGYWYGYQLKELD